MTHWHWHTILLGNAWMVHAWIIVLSALGVLLAAELLGALLVMAVTGLTFGQALSDLWRTAKRHPPWSPWWREAWRVLSCRCGHSREAHGHYNAATNCALCDCSRFTLLAAR